MTFGKYLKSLRLKQGLKLREVEKETGVSNSYISLLETSTRKNPPHPDILKKLAQVYKVSIRELMEMAGYLGEEQVNYEQEEIDRAFEFVIRDPNYRFGTRLSGDSNLDAGAKRFIVEMYEKATGKKLLGTSE